MTMKNALPVLAVLLLSLTASCGFGFADDLGTPVPPTNYWGWQCADGTAPDPDAGCLPASCDDSSTPAESDGGDACVCADGTLVLSCACQADGCGDGD
jgi:hypothetical protein